RALIADEVFAPYVDGISTLAGCGAPLTIVLDGLSKAAGLPQLKLGWMLLSGDDTVVAQAKTGLEWLLDAYLSVATPVQLAAPELLEIAPSIQGQIRARLRENHAILAAALAATPVTLRSTAGWYAVLALPSGHDEEDVVLKVA